jgi:hypothetical protein
LKGRLKNENIVKTNQKRCPAKVNLLKNKNQSIIILKTKRLIVKSQEHKFTRIQMLKIKRRSPPHQVKRKKQMKMKVRLII